MLLICMVPVLFAATLKFLHAACSVGQVPAGGAVQHGGRDLDILFVLQSTDEQGCTEQTEI